MSAMGPYEKLEKEPLPFPCIAIRYSSCEMWRLTAGYLREEAGGRGACFYSRKMIDLHLQYRVIIKVFATEFQYLVRI